MSEAQAIETEIEIETGEPTDKAEGFELEPETLEVEATEGDKPEADGPIEIPVDGGEKPAPRRLSRTTKRIAKAHDEAAANLARAVAAEEENKLLRMAQKQTLSEPDEDTFEGTDAEFKAAQRAYNQSEIKRIASEEAQTLVRQTIQQTTQANVEGQQDNVVDTHYERAATMNVTNYHELEGNAADIMGDDFTRAIILSSDNAHRILASLGASPREAEKIAALAKSNPTKAFADALTFTIHPSLSPASLNTIDPEQTVDSGSGVAQHDRGPNGATYE